MLRPLLFLAALSLLTRLPALAAALPGLGALLAQPAVEARLGAQLEDAKRRHAAKSEVARALADGRLGLAEATERFEAIDAGRTWPRSGVVSWARGLLQGEPSRLAELDARLAREAAGAR